MSSPKMTRMFGFLPSWAALAEAASFRSASASNAPRPDSSGPQDGRPSAAATVPEPAGGGAARAVRGLSAVAAAQPMSEPIAVRARAWKVVLFRVMRHLLLRRGHRAAEAYVRHARVRAAAVPGGGTVSRAVVVVAEERAAPLDA